METEGKGDRETRRETEGKGDRDTWRQKENETETQKCRNRTEGDTERRKPGTDDVTDRHLRDR